MPILLVVGLASLLLGIILFFAWFGHIIIVIKAALPAILVAGGAVVAYLGWEERRERRKPGQEFSFSNPDEARRYKAEARAYQEKLNEAKIIQAEVLGEAEIPGPARPEGETGEEA